MKNLKIFWLISWLSITCAQLSWAQEQPSKPNTRRNIIKFSLVSPIINSFSMAYERPFNPNTSFQLTMFYVGNGSLDTNGGFGITPEIRLYLSERREAPAGFFVAPFATYQNYQIEDIIYNFSTGNSRTVRGSSNILGLGIIVGGQWVFKNRVSIDVWGGPGYGFVGLSKLDDIYDGYPYATGPMGRFGCTLGFLF
jgi:hypothetical protein